MPGDNRFGAGEVIEVANYTVKFLRIRGVKFRFSNASSSIGVHDSLVRPSRPAPPFVGRH
jgi:hypothetical protein